MHEITRHFTATTFIVRDGRVLLHLHARQHLWLPPGGHLERDELPHDAARREIQEETGLELTLHSEEAAAELARAMRCGVVPQPAFILVEDIGGLDPAGRPFHQHIDFTYFARAPDDADLRVKEGFRWLAPEEMTMEGVPQNVREGARRALSYYSSISPSPSNP